MLVFGKKTSDSTDEYLSPFGMDRVMLYADVSRVWTCSIANARFWLYMMSSEHHSLWGVDQDGNGLDILV
jgi:hypothetical protein